MLCISILPRDIRVIQFRRADWIQFSLLTSFSIQIQYAFGVMSLWCLHPGTVSNQLFATSASTTIRLTNVGHGAVYRVFPVSSALFADHTSVHTSMEAFRHRMFPFLFGRTVFLVPIVHGNLPTLPAESVTAGLFVMMVIDDATEMIADHRVLPLVVLLDTGFGWHSVYAADVGHGSVVPSILSSNSRRSGCRHTA